MLFRSPCPVPISPRARHGGADRTLARPHQTTPGPLRPRPRPAPFILDLGRHASSSTAAALVRPQLRPAHVVLDRGRAALSSTAAALLRPQLQPPCSVLDRRINNRRPQQISSSPSAATSKPATPSPHPKFDHDEFRRTRRTGG